MENFTIDQLKQHFGGEQLIGRIASLNQRNGFGIIEAVQEKNGELYTYPDKRPVNDIVFELSGEISFERGDWVVVYGYELTDQQVLPNVEARLKALRVELLSEIGPIKDILNGDQSISKRRLLSGAIRSLQVVGGKALVLQQFLENERGRIQRDLADQQAQLQSLNAEINRKQRDLQHEKETIDTQRREILSERVALDDARSFFQSELARFGLDEQSLRTDTLTLSEDLIALLMSQAPIRERLKTERLQELAERESKLSEVQQELERQQEVLNVRESAITQREHEHQKQQELIDKKTKALEELRSALQMRASSRNGNKETVPFHQFASENELVNHIKDFIQGKGLHYDPWVIENFYTCLKTDYLVILSGISGAGKSKLPEVFAQAIGGEFELVPVRPDWNDNRDLLGFFNSREKKYQSTRFINFLVRANENPDRLFIVCLDEMNLAPIEYYFAQFLSVLEGSDPKLSPPDEMLTETEIERFEERAIIETYLLEDKLGEEEGIALEAIKKEIDLWHRAFRDLEKYKSIPVPGNIRFVGTVNVDHTARGFSDKVLDRVNVIQFERVDLTAILTRRDIIAKGLQYPLFGEFCKLKDLSQAEAKRLDDFVSQVRKINDILEPSGTGVGFRVLLDIERFMHLVLQSEYFADPEIAFDLQIKQRLLPKIRGMQSIELKNALEQLADFLKKQGYTRSYEKIAGRSSNGRNYGGMLQQLENRGYANYWEVN